MYIAHELPPSACRPSLYKVAGEKSNTHDGLVPTSQLNDPNSLGSTGLVALQGFEKVEGMN